MAKRALTYLLLIIGITHAYAMPVYENEWPTTQSFQSQQIMTTGVTYEGIIYTPFDDAIPSDLSKVGASYAPVQRKSPISGEGDWDELPDHGHTELTPIGEPWIMMFFALMFAGIIARRQRHIQNKTSTKK